ncbi:hypothetical protein HELRODRAFT_186169 [Helobdella robusta]|uniref:Uncharacterized protein n=1 Tax=Helobdella robusta TaxID=6412 RepID=T1FNR6_HELRO|nr:hypothetical protein HELRODRAFT_186169 [Helobdella robusta]ESN92026.1 hypothetical protein HELRODRAFT_186169 [Helobdella robusta]
MFETSSRNFFRISRNVPQITHIIKLSVNATARPLPRITIPHQIVQSLEKAKYKNLLKDIKSKPVYDKSQSNLIILCRRTEFNHYRGQTYTNFTPECLASRGWKSKKSKGDYIIINPRQGLPAFADEDLPSFTDLKLSTSLINVLKEYQIIQPTVVQSKVIPLLESGRSVLCAAETGNGKTLAYLLPIIERILKLNKLNKQNSTTTNNNGDVDDITRMRKRLNSPVAVIIAPSRELADQIYSVARDISSSLDVRVDVKCGGRRTQSILREMQVKPVDILIATPGILSKLLSNKFYNLSRLNTIAFDEADTLFDESFLSIILNIVKKLKVSTEKPVIINPRNNDDCVNDDEDVGRVASRKLLLNGGLQVVFVGATMPKGLQTKLNEVIDMESVEVVVTNYLHHILPHVHQKFVRLGPAQKLDHLLKVLNGNLNRPDPIPTIVFCNQPDTVSYLGHMMTSRGINHVTLHAQMPQIVREGRYETFASGESNLLIGTDLASRGLDTTRVRAQHVINYDFPHFISDYVHRAGRVGRVGSPHGCFVLNYVVRLWDVELMWKIETSVRRRTELANVNANIKKKLVGLHSLKMSKLSSTASHGPHDINDNDGYDFI